MLRSDRAAPEGPKVTMATSPGHMGAGYHERGSALG